MNDIVSTAYGNAEDGWPNGWTLSGQVIVGAEGGTCGYCALERYDPAAATTELLGATERPLVATMPQGDWAMAAGDFYTGAPSLGIFLLHLTSGETSRVDPLPRAVWDGGLPELPFLVEDALDPAVVIGAERDATASAPPLTPFAYGPGGRRMAIEALPSRQASVVVAPGGRWRVACANDACKVYGAGPRPGGAWGGLESAQYPDKVMMFAPDGDQAVFLHDGDLCLVDLPNGEPRRLGPWFGSCDGGRAGAVFVVGGGIHPF